jgi:hypothetical protein
MPSMVRMKRLRTRRLRTTDANTTPELVNVVPALAGRLGGDDAL